MKPIIFFCFSLFIAHSLFGQKIHITDTTNKWRYGQHTGRIGHGAPAWIWDYRYSDSLVTADGRTYVVLLLSTSYEHDSPIALMREDTTAGLVWMKIPGDKVFENLKVHAHDEFVFMDYNLSVNDTLILPLTYPRSYLPDTDTLSKHVVLSVDSLLINDVWHKRWLFHCIEGFEWGGDSYFIEGIGADKDILLQATQPPEKNWQELVCFEHNHTEPLETRFCDSYPMAIGGQPAYLYDLALYPNPVIDKLQVELKNYDKPCTITLYDVAGKAMAIQKFTGRTSVDMTPFAAGLYWAKIALYNNADIVRKIVVEK